MNSELRKQHANSKTVFNELASNSKFVSFDVSPKVTPRTPRLLRINSKGMIVPKEPNQDHVTATTTTENISAAVSNKSDGIMAQLQQKKEDINSESLPLNNQHIGAHLAHKIKALQLLEERDTNRSKRDTQFINMEKSVPMRADKYMHGHMQQDEKTVRGIERSVNKRMAMNSQGTSQKNLDLTEDKFSKIEKTSNKQVNVKSLLNYSQQKTSVNNEDDLTKNDAQHNKKVSDEGLGLDDLTEDKFSKIEKTPNEQVDIKSLLNSQQKTSVNNVDDLAKDKAQTNKELTFEELGQRSPRSIHRWPLFSSVMTSSKTKYAQNEKEDNDIEGSVTKRVAEISQRTGRKNLDVTEEIPKRVERSNIALVKKRSHWNINEMQTCDTDNMEILNSEVFEDNNFDFELLREERKLVYCKEDNRNRVLPLKKPAKLLYDELNARKWGIIALIIGFLCMSKIIYSPARIDDNINNSFVESLKSLVSRCWENLRGGRKG